MTASFQNVLEIREARFARSGGVAVRVPGLDLQPGVAACVTGASGAGKSTLLEGVLGVVRRRGGVRREAGSVTAFGAAWPTAPAAHRRALRADVAWLPQDPASAFDPYTPLGEQLARVTPRATAAARRSVLEGLGVADPALLARGPHAASGGQLQRIGCAVAALRAARLVLADEPTVGLDAARARDVIAALCAVRDGPSRPALLVATHDPELAAALDARPFALAAGVLRPGPGRAPRWPARRRREAGAVVLACRGAWVSDGHGRRLRAVPDLELRAGEVVALLGPSGVGKSVVARGLAGHLPLRTPRGGAAPHLPRPRQRTQLVFQDAGASLTPHRTPRELLQRARRAASGPAPELAALAADLDLDGALLERPCAQLSGGERRRVALARALAAAPAVLICDEPTAHLDAPRAEAVAARLVAAAEADAAALLWITHSEELAAAVADRSVRLDSAVAAPPGPADPEP